MADKTQIYLIVNGRRMSLAKLLKNPAQATEVYASGCTGLTTLDLPAATRVYASGCTGLTTLDLPAATWVYASGCTGLTTLDLPAATEVDASGCTGLPGFIHGGIDSRRYSFDSFLMRGQRRVFAGCRNYNLAEALEHWGPGGASDRPDCLRIVEKIIALAANMARAGGEAVDG
jgi:hypothetical protein